MKIIITGGGGTLGLAVCKLLSQQGHQPIIFSRNYANHTTAINCYNAISVVGNIKSLSDIVSTLRKYQPEGIIHAAANKHIGVCQNNPMDAIESNVIGTANVINAVKMVEQDGQKIGRMVFVGTDKICEPKSIYAMTKYLGEKMWQEFDHNTSCVRLGNILDSNGSVFQIWKKCIEEGKYITLHTIAGQPMKRFFITQKDAAEFIVNIYFNHKGNYVYFPKMPMIDMGLAAHAFANGRPITIKDFLTSKENLYEKIHNDEEFITKDEGVYFISEHGSVLDTKVLNYDETKAYLIKNNVTA